MGNVLFLVFEFVSSSCQAWEFKSWSFIGRSLTFGDREQRYVTSNITLLSSYLFNFLLAPVLWAQSRTCRQGASCEFWLGEHLFSWMQLYRQSVHIKSDKDFLQSAVIMKTSPFISLSGSSQDWKAGSIQLQSLKEKVLVYGTAPSQSTAGDGWFVCVGWLY